MTGSDSTRAVPEVSSNDLAAGSIFAEKFEILAKLGQGGMSSVYKARQLQMDRIVALKVMRPKFDSDGTSHKRFQREAQALCTLHHECVVKALTFGTQGQDCFIAMEYIEGISLSQLLLEKGRLPVEQVIQIVADVGRGLAHAHSKGIVHRDIKPGNIMLVQHAGQTKVQVVDFGLAKSIDGDSLQQKLTQTDHLIGTPFYMSPEQCTNGVLDVRSDIYSLGCVFYELLSGKPPFDGESAYAIMYGHLHGEPAALPPDAPPWLQNVVFKMIQREPGNRYQAVSDVVRVLVEGHDDEPLFEPVMKSTDNVGLTAHLRRLKTKRLWIIAFLSVGVSFLFFWIPSVLVFLRDDQKARSSKIVEDRKKTSDASNDSIEFGQNKSRSTEFWQNKSRVAVERWHDALEEDPTVGREHPKYTEAVACHRELQQLLLDGGELKTAADIKWAFCDRLWAVGKGSVGEDFGAESINDQLNAAQKASPNSVQSESTLALLLSAEGRVTAFQERYGAEFPKQTQELQRHVYKDLAAEYTRLNDNAGLQSAVRNWIKACKENCVERVRVTLRLARIPGVSQQEKMELFGDAYDSLQNLEAAHEIPYSRLEDAIGQCQTMANEFTVSDPAKANQCFDTAIRLASKKYGEDSAEVKQIQLRLANFYTSAKLLPQAKSLYVKLLPSFRDSRKDAIVCLAQLSKISRIAGNSDDAEKYLLAALKVNRLPSAPYYLLDREITGSWLLEVAGFAIEKKRPHDALDRATSALQALEGTTSPSANLMRSRAYNLQGFLLPASDRKQSKDAYRQAWKTEKIFDEISLHAIFTAQQLAAIAESEGDVKSALMYEKEALRICEKISPRDLRAAAPYKLRIERLTKALR